VKITERDQKARERELRTALMAGLEKSIALTCSLKQQRLSQTQKASNRTTSIGSFAVLL
jgi:hypothetical protein